MTFVRLNDPTNLLLPNNFRLTFKKRKLAFINKNIFVLDTHEMNGLISNVLYRFNETGSLDKRVVYSTMVREDFTMASNFRYLFFVGGNVNEEG